MNRKWVDWRASAERREAHSGNEGDEESAWRAFARSLRLFVRSMLADAEGATRTNECNYSAQVLFLATNALPNRCRETPQTDGCSSAPTDRQKTSGLEEKHKALHFFASCFNLSWQRQLINDKRRDNAASREANLEKTAKRNLSKLP